MRLEVLVHNDGEHFFELGAKLTEQVRKSVSAARPRARRRVESVSLSVVDEETVGPSGNANFLVFQGYDIQIKQVALQFSVAARRVPSGIGKLLKSLRSSAYVRQEVLKLNWLRVIGDATAWHEYAIGDGGEGRRRFGLP